LTADGDPGFPGMLAAGKTPREAWEELREQCCAPTVLAALAVLRRSPHGQAVLDRSRRGRGSPRPAATVGRSGRSARYQARAGLSKKDLP
jgi:hypothetical protein